MVRTASGAMAVQIVTKEHGGAGLWSTWAQPTGEAELAALTQAGREKIRGGQGCWTWPAWPPQAAGLSRVTAGGDLSLCLQV
nr:hypothetical protein [Actinomyces ruminis]